MADACGVTVANTETAFAGDGARAAGAPPSDLVCALPIVGNTTVEDAVFYVVVGTVGVFGWVQWPTAGLIGALHALHQRARNVQRSGTAAEVREALIDAVDEIL
jgi:hypothetical protein